MNGRTLIVGGCLDVCMTDPSLNSPLYTELFDNDSFETERIEPILDYYSYPALFVVEDGFCSKKKLNQNKSEP